MSFTQKEKPQIPHLMKQQISPIKITMTKMPLPAEDLFPHFPPMWEI